MPDAPLPDEQPAIPTASELAGSRPTEVLILPHRMRWWQRTFPVWWSILLGVACLLVGASVALWAFGLPRPDVAPQPVSAPEVGQPALSDGGTGKPAAKQILPTTATAIPISSVSPVRPSRPRRRHRNPLPWQCPRSRPAH